MSHDIQDLLDLIKELEERIIKLERLPDSGKSPGRSFSGNRGESPNFDSWYWDY